MKKESSSTPEKKQKRNKPYQFREEKLRIVAETENNIIYEKKLDLSIQQAKEGKTTKITTDEELKNLLDGL